VQDKRFGSDKNPLETRFDAQRIAFGPIVFQATRLLKKTGLLAAVVERGEEGTSAAEAAQKTGISAYAATVLLECGLAADLVGLAQGKFVATTLGKFVLHDAMTDVNMEFVHEVCYLGMNRLEEALELGKPSGLRELGEWKTVYEGLAHLPAQTKRAWLRFDHFYSDAAFPAASHAVLDKNPRNLLDIGCNTGKWAALVLSRAPELTVSLLDLPGQLEMAMANLREKGLADRATPCPVDLLDPNAEMPAGFDAVWMSQFLVCFSEDEVKTILARAARALRPGGRVWILDTFWDRQRFDPAAYCIINTSPYFTTIANGNSRMYRATDILAIANEVGLRLEGMQDRLGIYHSLLELVPA
jgi:ubiquinone/menaquinone biosynthesis C-methylase UbiE